MSEATERAREIVSSYAVQGGGRRVEVGLAMADYIEGVDEAGRRLTYGVLNLTEFNIECNEAKRKFEEGGGDA